MSVRSDKVQVSVEIDAKKGISELGKLEMLQKDLVKSLANMKKEAEGYTDKLLELERVNGKIDAQREKLGAVGMTMKQLKTQLGELTKQQTQSATFGTQQWDELQHKIEDVTAAIKEQENAKKGVVSFINPADISSLDELEEMQARITTQLKGMGEASKAYQDKAGELDAVNAEIKKHRDQLGITGMTLGQLKNHYKDLERQIEGMNYGTDEWKETHQQMRQVDGAIQAQSNRIKGLGGMWKWLKSEVAQMGMLAVGIMAVQYAAEKVAQVISNNAELSDSFANIEKATGLSANEVERLNNNLKNLDTRTKSKELRAIAVIGGQLGVPNKELESFIKNVDKAVVALGDEFAGGAEEVARELGALQKLFKDTKSMDTGEAINDIGSAVNALGAAGSATGPVIADFTKRIGALGDLGPNISQTLGLGAALQELGLSAEQSSGGVTNVILGMNKNAATFADFMDMNIVKYKEMMQNSPNDMLLQMAERFRGASSTSIVQTMEELGINSQEAVKVVALLSNQTEIVREKQELANQAMREGTSLTEEFAKKNDNFAAKLEKLGKQMAYSFVNSSITKGMEKIVDGLIKMTAKAETASSKFDKWKDQAATVKELEGSFTDLVDEYERLSSKTNRTADENERLQIVIDKIAKTVPSAVTEFDKYGKALGINTEAARKFVLQQRAMMEYNNRDTIKTTLAELKKLNNERTALTKTMNSKGRLDVQEIFEGTRTRQVIKKIPLTDKELTEMGDKVSALNMDILALEGNLAGLKGLKTDAEKALEDEVKTVTDLDFEKAKKTGKAKAPKKPKKVKDLKAEALKKQMDELLAWEKQMEDLMNANLVDEFERQRALARTNFTRTLEDVKGNAQQKAMLEKELRIQLNAELAAIDEQERERAREKAREEIERQSRNDRASAQIGIVEAGMELEFGKGDKKAAREKLKAARIAAVKVEREIQLQELIALEASEEEKQLVISNSEAEIAAIKADYRDNEQEAMIAAAEAFADIMLNMIDALSAFAQAAAENDMRKVEERKTTALSALDEEYSKGTIRKARYEKEKEKIEKQADERIRRIKNEQAEKEREAQIASTIIQGSIAVLSASQNPLGILAPQAIATSIAAALNLATVIAQPLPQYAEGGMTGRSIAKGGYQNSGPFLASMNEEGVEYVVPNYLLNDPLVADYVGMIESMRSGNHYGGKYAEGGFGPGKPQSSGSIQPNGFAGLATEQLLLEVLHRMNQNLENPKPAQAILDYDYYSRSTQEIEQVKQEAIAA